jgi:hypothetical protein
VTVEHCSRFLAHQCWSVVTRRDEQLEITHIFTILICEDLLFFLESGTVFFYFKDSRAKTKVTEKINKPPEEDSHHDPSLERTGR